MIIHNEYQQGSLEWMNARAGIPTASEFDNLVTPKFEIRTGDTWKTYVAKKVAEAWQGGPLPQFSTIDTEFGNMLEDHAIPWYELVMAPAKIERVGFITRDDGRVGCSPDGLIGKDEGIEIKCPQAHTHSGYLINGGVPKDYLAQVHGGMFVTERPLWKFLSFRRGFPPLLLTVERDDKIHAVLKEAIEKFLSDFDKGFSIHVERNGGPPRKRHFPHTQPDQHKLGDDYKL